MCIKPSTNASLDSTFAPGLQRVGDLLDRAAAFQHGRVFKGRVRGWRSAATLLALALGGSALAGPEGEQVVRGNVQFERSGNQTVIRAGDRSIINYRNFNIGANESVRFVQPGAESRVLNRINSATPTRIDGSLTANGRVYIVNPAGVAFGRGAVVNTAGLFAAAGQLSDADFIRGNDRFTGLSGSVVNEGSLQGQQIVMAGRQVANYGSIVAPQGTVAMAAGEEVFITQRDGAMHVRVSGTAFGDQTSAAVTNTGTIDTSSSRGGGRVIMAAGDVFGLAINITGTVKGKTVQVRGASTGDVIVGGTIDARDADVRGGVKIVREGRNRAGQTIATALTPKERKAIETRGGSIDIVGQRIALFNTTLDVSGANGGGSVRIGGDVRGAQIASGGANNTGNNLANAQFTSINSGTTIRADATQRGDGGSVVVWSDDTTRSFASISARGGREGGNGGFIETSGKNHLSVDGSRIDAGATQGRGQGGQWLLDPRNVTIDAVGPTTGDFSAVNPDVFTPNQDASVVLNSDITSRLDAGTSVTITTGATGSEDGDITVAADVLTTGTGATLRLDAANSIFVNSGVQIGATGAGVVNVTLNANRGDSADPDNASGAIVMNSGSGISTQGGNIVLGGGPNPELLLGTSGTSTYNGALRASAARGTALNPDGVSLDGASLNAGTGTIVIRGAGRNEVTSASGIAITNGSQISAGLVRIDGIGANFTGVGGDATNGVDITGATTLVRSVGGGVTINGTGGATDSGPDVIGVRIAGAIVDGFSNGFLTINGFGGSGTGARNHGILIEGAGQARTGGSGGLIATGRATGSGNQSHGVVVGNGQILSSSGSTETSPLRVVGVGSSGEDSVGVFVGGAGASITSSIKFVEIDGSSTGTLASNGVQIVNGSTVSGAGISVVGGSTNATGIAFTGGSSSIDSTSGNLTLRADSMDLASANFGGNGTLSIETRSPNTTIGLGDGAAGTLSISNIELANILSAPHSGLSFGSISSGLISTDTIDFSLFSGNGIRLRGTSLTTAGLSTTPSQILTLRFDNPSSGAGTVEQTGAIDAARLNLFGTSQFVLTNTANNFTTIAGNLSGALPNSIVDSDGFDIGTVGTNFGFIASNGRTIFQAQTGTLTNSADAIVESGELAFIADEVDFGANVGGSGLLTIRPVTDAQNVRLNGAGDSGANVLDLTASELAFLQDGFQSITIGSATGTGTFSFSAPTNFSDNVLLRMGPTGGTGSILVNQGVTATDGASITFRASSIQLASDVSTEGGAILFDGLTSLTSDVNVRTTDNTNLAGADITFSGGLDADSAANNRVLTVVAGSTGDVTFNGVVGAAERLRSLSLVAQTVSINGGVRTQEGQTYASVVNLAGDLSSNAGDVLFQQLVNITADSSVTTSGLVGDDVTFQQAINSTVAEADLAVNAGNGGIFLQGSNTLGRLTFNGATTTLNADLSGAELVFGGPVILEENIVATGTSSVVFQGTVNSAATEARTLTINSPATTLLGEIGTATDGILGALITDAGGTLALSSAIIRTTGNVDIGDTTTLGANTSITSTTGSVIFNGAVNSDATARALTLDGAQGVSLLGGAGGAGALQSLSVTGSGLSLGGIVETTTTLAITAPVTLFSDTTLRAQGVSFASTVNANTAGVPSLTVVSTGQPVSFAGAIGNLAAIRALDIIASQINLANVTTTGNQRYDGLTQIGGTIVGGNVSTIDFRQNVLLTSNSTIRTTSTSLDSDIIFGGTVNSLGASPFDLTIDSGGGDISFASDIGSTTTTGESSLANLNASGNSIVLRSARTTGRQIYTGATFLNGNLTSTLAGDIAIAGATQLLADTTVTTTAGNVTFSGNLDGDGAVGRSITVNTGGNGVTRFAGPVGSTSRLSTITTNADGSTVIATSQMRATGDQIFNDSVTLGANATFEGNDILFGSTLDSDNTNTPRNLTVNTVANGADTGETTFRGRVGGTRRLGSITTNSDGTTLIASDITTSRAINFGDAVLLAGNATLDASNASITFRSTINADSAATDPILTLRSNASGDADNPAFRFGANIGSTRRLGALNLGVDRSNALASTIVFSDSYDQQGRVVAAGVANTDSFTVTTASGGINVGNGHKIVSFGSLTLNALSGSVTFGDVTVLGDFRVTANTINLRTRGFGEVLNRSRQIERDSGADIVTAGLIDFSRAPVLLGNGFPTTFSPGNGQADADLAGFTFRTPARPITASDFADSGNSAVLLPLDLRASGPSQTNITTAIIQPPPGLSEPAGSNAPLLPSAAIEGLAELGISTRARTLAEVIEGLEGRNFDDRLPTTGLAESGIRNDILSASSVGVAVGAYRSLIYGPLSDDQGQALFDELGNPRLGDRTQTIREILGASWARYSQKAKKPTGEGWRAYLETQGTTGASDESMSLALLNQARETLRAIDNIGLPAEEQRIPRRKVIDAIKPIQITDDKEFVKAVEGVWQFSVR